jgi:uncharacterized OB-fold protein
MSDKLPFDVVVGVDEKYRQSLNNGIFLIQKCDECHQHFFYPRELCPSCGSAHFQWVRPKGNGVIYAVTTVRRRMESGGDYNVSLIELNEKVRLMSRVEGIALDEIRIGQEVRAKVEIVDGHGLLVFDAIQEDKK